VAIIQAPTRFSRLGIWLGFPSQIPSLINEGIGRYVFHLAKVLIKSHSVCCEIWCYQVNVRVVRHLFQELLEQCPGKIRICTELDTPRPAGPKRGAYDQIKNGGLTLMAVVLAAVRGGLFALKNISQSFGNRRRPRTRGPESVEIQAPARGPMAQFTSLVISHLIDFWESLNRAANVLAALANARSEADVFLIPLVTIHSGLGLRKKLIASLHDLFVLEYFNHFKEQSPARVRQIRQVQLTGRNFVKKGAFFISNSDTIRKSHVLRFLSPPQERTGFVYLPVMVPEEIETKLEPEAYLREKFGISGPFLFYPTQIRVYKNLIVLLKALKMLIDQDKTISLVLTGNMKGDNKSYYFYLENKLQNHVILIKKVTDYDLFGLYKYALATVVPTFSEGGFPFQGLEAMSMNTPAIMTDIPVVRERLLFHGLDPERSGLKLFAADDPRRLAHLIDEVMRDRGQAVRAQATVKEKLFSYTWDDVGRRYYDLLSRIETET